MALRRLGLLGLVLGLALSAFGPTCGPPAPAPAVAPDDVRTIEDFVRCLNGRLAGNQDVDISDSVQCLPKKCTITLTMSNISAQPACNSLHCQLPRVLITCPGPPRFMPSYLLCFENEGSKRIEIGEAIDAAGNMRMADIHFPEGVYENISETDILSNNDEKGCNSNGTTCHTEFTPPNTTFKYSKPIDPWVEAENGNPNCIIATDRCEPDRQAITEEKECFPPADGSRGVRPESLSEICQCIRDSRQDPEDPLSRPENEYIENLCDELEAYQATRGACAMAGCPAATGPGCEDLDAPCDPATGATADKAAGYHCKPVGEELQCVSDCPCRDYDVLGGGKFLVNGAVCMVRLQLDGLVATPNPGEFTDHDAITGQLSAFNYLTRTLTESVSFSSLTASRTGADFTVMGSGVAHVNGVTTNIEFTATQTGSGASFEVVDADTTELLCGSTGEDGRSAFQLTVGP